LLELAGVALLCTAVPAAAGSAASAKLHRHLCHKRAVQAAIAAPARPVTVTLKGGGGVGHWRIGADLMP
jgi:hypothetical protein